MLNHQRSNTNHHNVDNEDCIEFQEDLVDGEVENDEDSIIIIIIIFQNKIIKYNLLIL